MELRPHSQADHRYGLRASRDNGFRAFSDLMRMPSPAWINGIRNHTARPETRKHVILSSLEAVETSTTMASYISTLLRRDGTRQTQEFTRFIDGILWLAGELDTGDGYSIYGEIRLKENLVWRGGAAPPRSLRTDPPEISYSTAALSP